MDGWTDRQTDRQDVIIVKNGRWMDEQTDVWADRQSDRWTSSL